MRIFPVGREAPEGKSYRAGQENCQSIVHGQRSEDLILHYLLLKPLNCIQSKFRSRRLLQSGLMGLCGCNLKEKLECSNGIHDGRIDIRYALPEVARDKRFAERSEEIFFAQENSGGLCCRWNEYHQNLDMIDEMKHLPGA